MMIVDFSPFTDSIDPYLMLFFVRKFISVVSKVIRYVTPDISVTKKE